MLYFLLFWIIFKFCQKQNRHDLVLDIYFGVPGCGKTTFAAWLAFWAMLGSPIRILLDQIIDKPWSRWLADKWRLEKPVDVFSNVFIRGTKLFRPLEQLGVHKIRDALVILDEAGLDFNSRNFKSFPDTCRHYFKKFRHERTHVVLFSQWYNDMDITIRNLKTNLYVVRPSLIPYVIVAKKLKPFVDLDKNNQIAEGYKWGLPLIDNKYCFAPTTWKMFDTHEPIPNLEDYDFKIWGVNHWEEEGEERPTESQEPASQSTSQKRKKFQYSKKSENEEEEESPAPPPTRQHTEEPEEEEDPFGDNFFRFSKNEEEDEYDDFSDFTQKRTKSHIFKTFDKPQGKRVKK